MPRLRNGGVHKSINTEEYSPSQGALRLPWGSDTKVVGRDRGGGLYWSSSSVMARTCVLPRWCAWRMRAQEAVRRLTLVGLCGACVWSAVPMKVLGCAGKVAEGAVKGCAEGIVYIRLRAREGAWLYGREI